MQKQFLIRVGLAFMLAVLVASFTVPQHASAAVTKKVNLVIFKSSKVTASDSTLKSYAQNAISNVNTATSPKGVYVQVKSVSGPYSGLGTGCEPGGMSGNRSLGSIAVNFYEGQLRHNGYGWGGSAPGIKVDLYPGKGGTCPCDSSILGYCNTPFDQALTTHEMGHVFKADHCNSSAYNDSDDLCGKLCGQICYWSTGCVMQYFDFAVQGIRKFCSKDAQKMVNELTAYWPNN